MKDFKLQDVYSIIVDKVESWITSLIAILPNMAMAIIVLLLFFLLARIISRFISRSLSKLSQNYSLNHLIANVLYIIVVLVGAFVALDILKLEKTVTSLLAGIGVIGLALGFAFQDIAANFISGIILTIKTPIKSGDIVKLNGIMGTVVRINLRATEIETFQGTLVIVPNKSVFQSPIFNYSHFQRRRIDLEAGVSFNEDLEKVKEMTIEAVKTLPLIDKNKEVLFQYSGFGESRIKFTVKAWLAETNQKQYREALSQMIMAMKKVYDEKGVKIPFPIRTLDFKNMKEDIVDSLADNNKKD